MTEQLKQCPFCGGDADYVGKEVAGYNVKCTKCGAMGPWGDYGYQCAKAWNTRAAITAMRKDAAMDRLVAEGQRCDAMTPQEAAKVLLTDIISGRDDYARLLKDQPCGGFIGLRASLRAISEDSHE